MKLECVVVSTGLRPLLPHKKNFVGKTFRDSIDGMYFAFCCSQFLLISTMGFDYLCFSPFEIIYIVFIY